MWRPHRGSYRRTSRSSIQHLQEAQPDMSTMKKKGIASLCAGVLVAIALAAFTAGARADHMQMATGGEMAMGGATSQQLAAKIALARVATAKYATDMTRAKRDGYGIITQMIPDMGWKFINPNVTRFNVRKPPILLDGKRGSRWQLVAFEWVFPSKPKTAPLPGATYGSFGAACHYKDGTFTFTASQDQCAAK